MIRHIWSVLCKEATINQDNNALSIRDVLEQISLEIEPIGDVKRANEDPEINLPVNFEIISFFSRNNSEKDESFDFQVSVISPDGKEFTPKEQQLTLPIGIKRMRSRFGIYGLAVKESGEYTFRVSMKQAKEKAYTTASEIPLEVFLKVNWPKQAPV